MRSSLLLALLLALAPLPSRAQDEAGAATALPPGTSEPEPLFRKPRRARPDAGAATAGAGDAGVPLTEAPGEKAAAALSEKRLPARPLEVPKAGDADIAAAVVQWRAAWLKQDRTAQEKAEHDLLRLREDLGISDLEAVSLMFLRAGAGPLVHEVDRTVALDSTAAELSPGIPYAHFALARSYLVQDPSGIVPAASEVRDGVLQIWRNFRYRHMLVADVGGALCFAWVATGAALMLTLAFRRIRYLLHDLHHRFFPKSVARWQSAVLICGLLLLPSVFRLGLLPQLLVLLVALSAYLSWRERILSAVFLGSLAVLPLALNLWVRRSVFEGTPAADVYVLEEGGPDAQPVAARLLRRLGDEELGFASLFALARYEQRRGQLTQAEAHFKLAAQQKPGDARLLTDLGNLLQTAGDSEGAADLYNNATQADPTLAPAFFNAARLHQRRSQALRDEALVLEMEKANSALNNAQNLDPSLASRPEPPPDNFLANRHLIAVPLDGAELDHLTAPEDTADRVSRQLSAGIVGNVTPSQALIYPPALVLLALLLGLGKRALGVSHACEKCGRPVCRKCDPELDRDSALCNQCVHAFARKGALPAAASVRKQIEVQRYQSRHEQASYALGLLVSGAGDVFNGYTVRGTFYAFLFLLLGFALYLPHGLLRGPYVGVPTEWRLLPLGLLFAAVYATSLRGLYRRLNS